MDHEVEVRREIGMALRVTVQAIARSAEQRARRREQQMRAIEQASREKAQRLREEFAAHRAAAETQLKPVFEPAWIDQADTQRITDTYLMAREWAKHSPTAEAAAADIRYRMWQRTGVDIDPQEQATTEPDPAHHPTADERTPAATEQATEDAMRDRATANALVAEARRAAADHERREDADNPDMVADNDGLSDQHEHAYDSPQRRDALRTHLDSLGVDEEAIEARMFAARQNAHPITEALNRHTSSALTGEDDEGNVISFRQRSTDMER